MNSLKKIVAPKAWLTSALALGISLPTTSVLADEPTFTLMSYNIRFNTNNPDDPNTWQYRRNAVTQLIGTADIIGTQEGRPEQLNDISNDLPSYAWTGLGRDANGGGEAAAIFYKRDRFELLDRDTFYLSQTPNEWNTSTDWDAQILRIASWGKFRDKRTGKEFYFFNTHFDHVGSIARAESATLMLNQIATIAGDNPVILAGDFNATPNSTPYTRLTHAANGLQDARGADPTSTYNNFSFPTGDDKLIDYIFYDNAVNVNDYTVITDTTPNNTFPSDHYPITTKVSIASNGDAYTQLVNAEDYTNQFGTNKFTSNKTEYYIGSIHAGDHLEYSIYVPKSQEYTLQMRIADLDTPAQAEILANSQPLTIVDIPITGGWENWKTINQTVFLNEGFQTIKFNAITRGWNLDWWTLEAADDQQVTVKIKNRWTGKYLYDAGDRVEYAPITQSNSESSSWIIEPISKNRYELRNAHTGDHIHIENKLGHAQCTSREPIWWSARWKLQELSNGYIQLQNYWDQNQFIHTENANNIAQSGSISSSWWSAQWVFEPTP